MSEREELLHELVALSGSACVTAGLSPRWAEALAPILAYSLRAHDERIRAEALAPVLALADPDAMGRAMWQVSGLDEGLIDLAAPVAAAALRAAAGTPTHHTTEEDA